MIDIHAHAAGDYGSVDSIKIMVEKYGIEKIALCTSPKNNHNLPEPPVTYFKQKPDSIFMMNRMNRIAYKYFFKDNGDGGVYLYKNCWENYTQPNEWPRLEGANNNKIENNTFFNETYIDRKFSSIQLVGNRLLVWYVDLDTLESEYLYYDLVSFEVD